LHDRPPLRQPPDVGAVSLKRVDNMTKNSYAEKLKDPRWQKKRLEALSNADFCCEACCDSTSTLHVHHKQYFKGREPWEYDVEQLGVLCESCHAEHHSSDDLLSVACSYAPIDGGPWSRDEIAYLVAGFIGLEEDAIAQRDEFPERGMNHLYRIGLLANEMLSWNLEFKEGEGILFRGLQGRGFPRYIKSLSETIPAHQNPILVSLHKEDTK
jgi:hypothetical protein